MTLCCPEHKMENGEPIWQLMTEIRKSEEPMKENSCATQDYCIQPTNNSVPVQIQKCCVIILRFPYECV